MDLLIVFIGCGYWLLFYWFNYLVCEVNGMAKFEYLKKRNLRKIALSMDYTVPPLTGCDYECRKGRETLYFISESYSDFYIYVILEVFSMKTLHIREFRFSADEDSSLIKSRSWFGDDFIQLIENVLG